MRDINSLPNPFGRRLDPIIIAHAKVHPEETPQIMAADDEVVAADVETAVEGLAFKLDVATLL